MLLAGVVLLLPCRVRAEAVTLGSLVDEMADRDTVTYFKPGTRVRLWSSYDRASIAPGCPAWFANDDGSGYIRAETNSEGRVEFVMVAAVGAGALVRCWATAGDSDPGLVLRIYLDGNDQPAIVGPLLTMLSSLAPAPLSARCPDSDGELHRRGHNLYLPIPYAKSCKVTYERPADKSFSVYFNFETLSFPPGTVVETYSREVQRMSAGRIDRAAAELVASNRLTVAGARAQTFDGTLEPGQSVTRTFEGTGAVRRFAFKADRFGNIGHNANQSTRELLVTFEFDGRETVSVPHGEFFGCGPLAVNPFVTRFAAAHEDGLLESFWVMPFERFCTMTLRNISDQPIVVSRSEIVCGDYRWDPARSMHFAAEHRMRPHLPTRRSGSVYDLPLAAFAGTGTLVGTSVFVVNADRRWWGEGDEKIFVDGERFPSFFGTGTEDFFGYAWSSAERFVHPLLAQPYGGGARGGGEVVNLRTRILDAVPFTSSLRFDMEMWHWGDTFVDYDSVVFAYLRP